ncbi:Cholesterol oxidase [Gordonia insulae]|uniref:Cholesterol oxidase n=1 Tax=Gordonia insulae TaxID=2420509 RepID=A0A3G8JMC9_9ACTN|nr:Cholesterol oxidase [Gordonia insulae]
MSLFFGGARQNGYVVDDLDAAVYSAGVATTSSFHPDSDTHIEPVRYGKGSNALAVLQTYLTRGDAGHRRLLSVVRQIFRDPSSLLSLVTVRRWSQRSVVLLVMQNRDNSLTTSMRKLGPLRFVTSRQGHGELNPTWIPAGNEAAERGARALGDNAQAVGTWGDVFNVPMTAHYLGGCVISDRAGSGVIDPYHRVWNYPTLHITDGAAISANLGVNPSLTICAQAERALALWPNRGEADSRPRQGHPYKRLRPEPPRHPVVPADAPAALVLPFPRIRGARDSPECQRSRDSSG